MNDRIGKLRAALASIWQIMWPIHLSRHSSYATLAPGNYKLSCLCLMSSLLDLLLPLPFDWSVELNPSFLCLTLPGRWHHPIDSPVVPGGIADRNFPIIALLGDVRSKGLINTIAEDLSGVFASVVFVDGYMLNHEANKGLLISYLASNKGGVVRGADKADDDIEGRETNYGGVELGDVCSEGFPIFRGLKDSRRVVNVPERHVGKLGFVFG